MVLYRRRVRGGGELEIDGVRDYATVFQDARYIDSISRVVHPSLHSASRIRLPPGSDDATLDILVDSFGHVGYGHAMADRKGIVGGVMLDGATLRNWDVFGLPLDAEWLGGLRPLRGKPMRPGVFFKAALTLARAGDCYLDMSGWNKGYLWVNGRLLGRYWHLGPQQRLYCPAPWLRAGDNEVLVFDLHRTGPAPIRGVRDLHD